MATKTWTGAGSKQAKVVTWTIGSSTVGHTFTATSPNGSVATYTAVTGDTTATIATALAAACEEMSDGQFTELSFEADGADVVITGPSDGAPFTLTSGGTGTITPVTTTSELSPHTYTRAANWLGGVAPIANDDVVFDRGAVDVKYELDGFTGTAFTSWKRLQTYTGRIGLADTNTAGYVEYRATHCEVNSTTIHVEQPGTDGQAAIRLKAVHASATAVKVVGTSGTSATPGTWTCEIFGTPANSTVTILGGSLAIAPFASQTATVLTITSTNGSLLVGAGVTLSNPTIKGGLAEIATNYATLTLDEGAIVTVTKAATCSSTNAVMGGTIFWQSTGNPLAAALGSNGVFDLSACPSNVAFTNGVTSTGGVLLDPLNRITRPFSFAAANLTLLECGPPNFGTGISLTVN